MKTGELVQAIDYKGTHLKLVVVANGERVIHLCSEEEWQASQMEKREPVTTGFPKEDVRPLPAKDG